MSDARIRRVLHVITGLGLGGAETMLCRLLSKTEPSVLPSTVISLSSADALEPRISELGVPVHKLDLRLGWSSWSGIARLCGLARKIQPDIIHGWMPHGNLGGLLTKLALHNCVPLIWCVRQSLYDLRYETPTTARLIRLGAKLSRLPKAIIYNSHTGRQQHEELGFARDHGVVIPNGFEVHLFVPSSDARHDLRSELGLSQDTPLVGIIGRFHPMKDHHTFLRAAATVLKRHVECRFVMIGPNVDWQNQELTAFLQDSGIVNATYLLGTRRDIHKISAGLDVMVSSSFTEAFPNVIGEAMSCGVPCVVTDVGDSAWLVGDTGIVVPPRNPDRLAMGINELLELPPHRFEELRIRARNRIVSEFSLDIMADSFKSLYFSISAQERLNKC